MKQKSVLIFQSSGEPLNRIANLLKNKGYEVIVTVRVDFILEKLVEESVQLILCPQDCNGESGFVVYKRLKPFLLKSAVPFMLILNEYDKNDILIGLEMGIDNFILQPVIADSLLAKVSEALKKRAEVNIFNLESFKYYFSTTDVAMFFMKKDTISEVNDAFCRLTNTEKTEVTGKPVEWLFQMGSNSDNELHFRRFMRGATDVCKVQNVSCNGEHTFHYNISFYRGNQYDVQSAFAELLPVFSAAHNFFSVQPVKSDTASVTNTAKQHFSLTKREVDVYRLSAKGLPVKQVAANLNVSERTVEKHRANIMRKTKTKSIFEATLVIKGEKVVTSV